MFSESGQNYIFLPHYTSFAAVTKRKLRFQIKNCNKTLWNQGQNEVQGYFAPPSPPEGKIANENEDKRAEIF